MSTPETHRRAVGELFDAMHMGTVLDVALNQAIKNQLEVQPEIRKFEGVMRRFMGKYMSLAAIQEPLSKLYVERFTELELTQLAAFYRTPLGERTLSEMPKLLEEASEIGRSLVEQHKKELIHLVQDELRRSGQVPAPPPDSQ